MKRVIAGVISVVVIAGSFTLGIMSGGTPQKCLDAIKEADELVEIQEEFAGLIVSHLKEDSALFSSGLANMERYIEHAEEMSLEMDDLINREAENRYHELKGECN